MGVYEDDEPARSAALASGPVLGAASRLECYTPLGTIPNIQQAMVG